MLRTAKATRYVVPLREGGSLPAIVEADDLGLYVVKFRGAGQGILALIAELLAGEIGRALGLRVPEIILIDIDAALGRNEPDYEIRQLLKAKLPPYMVPSAIVTLERLPVTANGKLDRLALPAPDGARPDLDRAYVAPDSPIEEALAEVWSEVLGIDRVGTNDDFFDLGGHSMLAVRMLSSVHDVLGVELSLVTIFDRPTIRELADAVTVELVGEYDHEDLASLLSEAESGK